MPRKDKKKKTKKPKTKAIAPKIIATLPRADCWDCGYKSGSAFTIPFGYADRFGTQRLSAVSYPQPIINVNIPSNYYKPELVAEKPIPEDFGILAELIPITLLFSLIKGPPEFPSLIGASV
jgi:hypothetical protein